jgi:hypothetical protein
MPGAQQQGFFEVAADHLEADRQALGSLAARQDQGRGCRSCRTAT